MVRKRQEGGEPVPENREVAFSAPAGRPAGVEVLTLAELRARADACRLSTPHRPGFHHLLLLDRGRLVHSVDFREHVMAPGDLLWSRPGQVQHFGDLTGAEGRLVLFEAGFLDPATAAAARIEDWYGPPVRHPEGAAARGFTRSRRVTDYARSLGYAPRTLSRATEAAAGVGAKEFIDRRVVLEAKRLLAHGDQSAARIADRLGFADATNFSKFFQRQTGTTPIAFRVAVRGGAG
ncbi:AraC family transcriptional regulator [Streptomyces lydicus]|uniref:AraC family transcriptional regulator n=1 Tax=Streptomyces lydicus TaxID=47763 RepID=A0A3S9YAL1_9ACTN|nr:AraC family transcriptional regulator [Streptomyces lydicus]AZS71972.1 AraC family transcriptional regulator [Streptomyces lydicus]